MKISAERIFLLLCMAVVAYGFYCYNPFTLYFQNDDFIHIPLGAKGELFQRNSFRPICDLVMMIDYAIWKKSAVGYHFSNLVLHIIACCLAYWLTFKVVNKYSLVKQGRLFSFTLSVLFFIYATHSEAVFWILGRSAIIGFIFGSVFLLVYMERREEFSWKLQAAFSLLLALLSYESNFILPLICCVLYKIDKQSKDSPNLLLIWITFSFYLVARVLVTGEFFGTYEVTQLSQSVSSIFVNYGKLFYRGLVPAYSQPTILVAAFGLTSVIFLRLWKNKKARIVFLLYIISLLPYSLLGIDAHGYEGERYLYYPAYFIALTLLLLLFENFINRHLRYSLVFFLLVIHSCSLVISSANFRLAGKINQLTIQEINKLPPQKELIIQQLPQSQNGALLLRSGFKDAIHWLCTKPINSIKVISIRGELQPFDQSFRVIHVTKPELSTKSSHLIFTDSALYVQP